MAEAEVGKVDDDFAHIHVAGIVLTGDLHVGDKVFLVTT